MQRRMKYNSLAKIVHQQRGPSTQRLQALIQSIHTEIETLKREEDFVDRQHRGVAGIELSPLMQCVNDMQLFNGKDGSQCGL